MVMRPAAVWIWLVLCVTAAHGQQPANRTVLDGVFSEVQVARGEEFYTRSCGACHGRSLKGVSAPSLNGERFIERWREGMLDPLYSFIKERMPPTRDGNARSIPESDYLDILIYILKTNGYPSGNSELTNSDLSSVMLVGKNGPQPVPDGSLVATIGCLTRVRDGIWMLTRATEPARTGTSTTSAPGELTAASQGKLGTLGFALVDLEAVPDFAPDAHEGHKVQAKGYLTRQTNAERISLSAIAVLDSTCTP